MQIGLTLSLTNMSKLFSPGVIFSGSQPGVWFDPSNLSTLFQDSAGTIPVTAVGDPVGKMLDISGNGNHATQSTSSFRPTYQIDGTGRPYLLFDGTDDTMITPVVTPGTDKVQVFAGARKIVDASQGVIVELSPQIANNNGSFLLSAPNSTGATNFGFFSKGTTQVSLTASPYAPPFTAVVTGLGDISTPSAAFRVNGVQKATNAGSQGTGNYLPYALNIGRRQGGTSPFNGYIYGLIVRFGDNLSDDQITSTEGWMNTKTGAY